MQLELRPVMNDPNVNFNPIIFLTNASAAFALNMSVFMLIGRTSALTMNVAGVVKVNSHLYFTATTPMIVLISRVCDWQKYCVALHACCLSQKVGECIGDSLQRNCPILPLTCRIGC